MIYTSYFAKIKELEKNNIVPISICGKAPDWYKGLQYKKFAPKYDFFMKWKETKDNDYYIKCFNEQVLDKIDISIVLEDLYFMLPKDKRDILDTVNCPFWCNPDIHLAFICYEKSEDFCHRHLVADWFKSNEVACEEYSFNE